MNDLYIQKIQIETVSPAVLTAESQSTVMTGSRDSFNGSVLRGVMAARYIECCHLGKDAEKDSDFLHLFFQSLRFADAFPVRNGQRAIPVPLSVVKDKSGKDQQNLFLHSDLPGYKPVKGLGYEGNGRYSTAEVKKNISLHMSRASEKERIIGRSIDGAIYNYESIDAGQIFEGEIIGSSEDLNLLSKGLHESRWTCRIGRSRRTGYGECSVSLLPAEPVPAVKVQGSDLYIRMETPLLFGNSYGFFSADQALLSMLQKRTGITCKIGGMYASACDMDRFTGVWGMRGPRAYGLSAGSVFQLTKDEGWSEKELQALTYAMYEGIGRDCVSGFGQLRLWKGLPVVENAQRQKTERHDSSHLEEARRVVQGILMKRVLEKAKLLADEDAGASEGLKGQTHTLSRLEQALGDRPRDNHGDLPRHFLEEVKKMSDRGEVMDNHLQKIRLGDDFLQEWFHHDAGNMPYEDKLRIYMKESIPKTLWKMAGWTEDITKDDRIFYEYWLWFFRHGRKRSAALGKEEE